MNIQPRLLPLLLLLLAATTALAQQSNKSKSKDRYREKTPQQSETGAGQRAAWMQLAASRLRPVTFALSEVMLHDVASPPAASRFYAYALLAGYETAARYQQEGFPTLQGTLKAMPPLHSFTAADSVFYPFAALYAILETGKKIMPSGYLLAEKQTELERMFREKGLPEAQIAGSIAAASAISGTIADYAAADGYPRLTAFPRYRPADDPGAWQPTPPDWMAAIEPNWSTLRPFFLDSVQQFRPAAPVPFDTVAGSPFLTLLQEVYDAGRNLTPGQRETAEFWDCNPFAVQHAGHLKIGLKKISPGGHWVNICGLACEQQKRSFRESLTVHTALALALADAFIACWDEKYRTNRIRPLTAINRRLDANWQPLLQTPPFPEYTSGHSMASAAAAEVLAYFLGNDKPFTDYTQTLYGMKPRRFASFRRAAEDAAISRLYGGIHFRDAIEQGSAAGRQIGKRTVQAWPARR